MKNVLRSLIACSALTFASMSNAALITESEILSTVITEPSGWTTVNETVLFDGFTATNGPGTGRFIGFRNSGSALSPSNPFDINITFNNLMNLSSFGLYNDWGNVLNQSLSTIELSGYDAGNSIIASQTLTGLDTGSFAPSIINLTNFAGADIKSLLVSITGINGTNFEIREFAIEATASSVGPAPMPVSAPAMGAFMALLGAGMVLRRNRKVAKQA